MKQRFSSLDIKIISKELSDALCGLRVANIYDLSSRIFLFKFAKPNDRKQVVVDSGFRCHLTSFSRATAAEPSAFVARLRKFLRTRRVTEVSQIGTDRVIQFQFSDGQYKLILEFFAGGNVILTDRDLNIISLLRIVPKTETQEELRVGLKYSLEDRQNFAGVPLLTEERVRDGLRRAINNGAPASTGKKNKQKPGDAVRKALANSLTEFPPILLEHALTVQGFDFSKNVEDVLEDTTAFNVLMAALKEAQEVVANIMAKPVPTGYIIAKTSKRATVGHSHEDGDDDVDKENTALVFDDFHPFLPKQVDGQTNTTVLEIEGFNATVDQFFSSIESQKLESRLQERQDHADKKLQAARNDHAARVEGLQQVQQLNVRKAQAIENSILWVGEACAAVNGLIGQGMDWVEIDRLIEMEQARNNPVARLIHLPLKLYENTVTLLLAEEAPIDQDDGADMADETESEDSDDDENEQRAKQSKTPSSSTNQLPGSRLSVDIDLGLTPWANARIYYDQKKSAAVKEEKTKQSSVKALKSTEQKVKLDLQKGLKQEKDVLRPVRKQLWFEKYYYFISSEGYLIVGGRDKAQVDVLYSRYFESGDAWVHSEAIGATPVIVKNKRNARKSPIPALTLSQAGSFCTIMSQAWDSKAIMGSWWVECEQVTKIDSTGQYLAQGDFVIKGERQNLPPAQLLLGFGVMFRVSPESRANHNRHRLIADTTVDDISGGQMKEDERHGHEPLAEEPSHQEGFQGIYEDAQSGASEPASDNESSPEFADEAENGTQYYSNPLQSSPHEGSRSVEMNSRLQDLSLAKGESGDGGSLRGDSSDTEGSDQHDIPETTAAAVPDTSGETATPTRSDSALSSAKANSNVRGKKAKRAKMKNKYADQDEEDRELAMQVLGSRPKHEKPKDSAEIKKEREALAAQQKERRREQHQSNQASGKAAEEERQKKFQSNQEIMSEEDLAELDQLDYFVGMPLPDDEILDYLVVCGPWDAIGSRLRWRTKIQPGSIKKGKAVKEILGSWIKFIADKEKKRPPPPDAETYAEDRQLRKEAGMIKAVRDVEVIGIIPVGKVRLMTSGGDKNKGGKQTGKSGKGGRKKR